MLKVYIDAATKGNPGPSGGGAMITGAGQYQQLSFPLGIMSNHEAEFAALIKTLQLLIKQELNQETIFIFTDSKVLAQTIEKNYTSNAAFQPYLAEFQQLETTFPLLIIQWLAEKENKGADNLARQGLQKQLKKKTN
ncbi:ribonuclease HI family protein [Enterococcus sp. LJL120]